MKRQPGRPPLDVNDPSVPLTVSMPSKQLAAVSQKAEQDRVSVQAWIRRVLRDASSQNKSV
jgi:predicted DNA binding CopG/RHH family protein